MRSLILMGALVAACSSEQGAILVIAAPDGPTTAASIQIVLASAESEMVTDVDPQRIAATGPESEGVRYYRQRARGGELEAVGALGGLTIRIEPEFEVADDREFIPFLLVKDDAGRITGVGSVNDERGEPMKVSVEDGTLRRYPVTMWAVAQDDDANDGIAEPNGAFVVTTSDQVETWITGVAWRPGGELSQRRLLLPLELLADNATDRDLDLDGDGGEAWSDDCNDLLGAFHEGAGETCGGQDTNCDGRSTDVVSCTLENPDQCPGEMGVRLCSESQVCQPTATCNWTNGAGTQCTLDYMDTSSPGTVTPCAPAIGPIALAQCTFQTPCTVSVAAVAGSGGATSGDWEATIALANTGPFESALTGVHGGKVYLRVKPPSSDIAGSAGTSIGAVYLRVGTSSTDQTLIGISLRLDEAPGACVSAGDGDSLMTCTSL